MEDIIGSYSILSPVCSPIMAWNPRARWRGFLSEELFPHLLHQDDFVRNVLRTVGLAPCKSKQNSVFGFMPVFGRNESTL